MLHIKWHKCTQLKYRLNQQLTMSGVSFMDKKNELLRSLPKVDECLLILLPYINEERIPTRMAKTAVQETIDKIRQEVLSGNDGTIPQNLDQWTELFVSVIEEMNTDKFKRVINGSGVIIHTNMGRSLLSDKASQKLSTAASHYTNLELDLSTGKRGSRYSHVEDVICELTGAEAALVVNNNAAAVLIALETIANQKEVIVSRGQLVEIGGSFRIPEVMEKSGATLVEIGATNRTHLFDYERAISEQTALLLKVHTSNFRVIGFTSEVSAEEMVELGKKFDIPVMEDLGSGSLIDMSQFGLPGEPTVQDVLKSGVDIVTFSGDKLLGGPQAGIIVGSKNYIDQIKKNPLNRALRIDKFTLSSLESTLRSYYGIETALKDIPTLRMISEKPEQIKRRAQRFGRKLNSNVRKVCSVKLVKTLSRVGGGSLPEYSLDSWAIELKPQNSDINTLERAFRAMQVPLIGRIEHDNYLIDFRTVQDHEVLELAGMVASYFMDED